MAVEIIGDDSDCDLKIDESYEESDINSPTFFASHTSIPTINCLSPRIITTRTPSPIPENEDFSSKSLRDSKIDGITSNNMENGNNRKRKHCLEIEVNSKDGQNTKYLKTESFSSNGSEKKCDNTYKLDVKFHHKFNSSIFISTQINNQEMHGILMPGPVIDNQLSNDKNEKGIENFDPATLVDFSCNNKNIIKKEDVSSNKYHQSSPDVMPSTSKADKEANITSPIKSSINDSEKDDEVTCPLDNCGYKFVDLKDVSDHLKSKHSVTKKISSGQGSQTDGSKGISIGIMTDMVINNKSGSPSSEVLHKPKAEKISPATQQNNVSNNKNQQKTDFPKMDPSNMLHVPPPVSDPKALISATMAPFNFQPPGLPQMVKPNFTSPSSNQSTNSTPIKPQDNNTKHKIHELKPTTNNSSPNSSKNARANSTSNSSGVMNPCSNSVLNNYQLDSIRPSSVTTSLAGQGTGMPMGLNPFSFPHGNNPFTGISTLGIPNQGVNSNQLMNMFNPMMMQAAAAQMRNPMFMMPNMNMQGSQQQAEQQLAAMQMAMLTQMQQQK
uniref:C2H2-type domain-containing protein n=1 Tax=Parastrongyloides trichosuri TaxID=131310 RepID=A0A0N4Z2R7_PARTI